MSELRKASRSGATKKYLKKADRLYVKLEKGLPQLPINYETDLANLVGCPGRLHVLVRETYGIGG